MRVFTDALDVKVHIVRSWRSILEVDGVRLADQVAHLGNVFALERLSLRIFFNNFNCSLCLIQNYLVLYV